MFVDSLQLAVSEGHLLPKLISREHGQLTLQKCKRNWLCVTLTKLFFSEPDDDTQINIVILFINLTSNPTYFAVKSTQIVTDILAEHDFAELLSVYECTRKYLKKIEPVVSTDHINICQEHYLIEGFMDDLRC